MEAGLSKCVDIVLIEPPYDRRTPKPRSQPQLGLAYIASYLEQNGITVKIIDGCLDGGLTPLAIAEKVAICSPMAVGLTCCTDDRFIAIDILREIKNKNKQILAIAGGPHFSQTANDALQQIPEIDVVCLSEGEMIVAELLRSYSRNRSFDSFYDVRGIAFRGGGQIVVTKPREPIANLDIMPAPAWHLFEMEKYTGSMSAGAPHRAIGLISSRGCPYSCIFCCNRNKKVRYLSPKRFVDDVQYVMEKYGFTAFNFVDDSFTSNSRHVKDICDEIICRGLDLKWYCSLRLESAARNIELLRRMKDAGCIALGFGVEFAHDEVLKAMRKNVTFDVMKEGLRNVKKVGYPYITIFRQNSFPGQNLKNTLEGYANLLQLHQIIYGANKTNVSLGGWIRVYPGTEIEILAKRQKNIFPDGFSWNRSFRSKYADTINKKYWSVPLYRQISFPLERITFAQKIFRSYIRISSVIKAGRISAIIKILFDPRRWKDAINTVRFVRIVKRRGEWRYLQ